MVVQSNNYQRAVQTVIGLCFERLDEELDLGDLAAEVGYSRFHFHRIFSAIAGESPMQFLRRVRLERAAKWLSESDVSIGEIAVQSGYASPDAFSRSFRQAFSVLPSEFRIRKFDCRIHSRSRIHYGFPIAFEFSTQPTTMNTTIENRPEYHVIGLPHKGAYWQIGRTFQKVGAWRGEKGIPAIGSLAVFHDDPEKVAEADLRSDALVAVAEPMTAEEGFVSYTIPAGKYLVGHYVGSYEGLSQAWGEFFGKALPEANVTPREGYTFEWYVDDCNEVPVDQLRTDLFLPITD